MKLEHTLIIPKAIMQWVGLLAIVLVVSPGTRAAEKATPRKAGKTAFNYRPYAKVLKKHVNDKGMVDYKALKAHRKPLDTFVRSLGKLKKQRYKKWEKKSQIAFWINAYNAITLKIIIDNYPIEAGFFGSMSYPSNSIRQISGVFDEITHKIMGKKMTLDDIEHKTLRKDFNEPRIHIALVCAAMSCPRLLNQPYTAKKLDDQFGMQAHQFVRQPDNFKIERDNGYVYISSIFDWFGQDFIKTYAPKKAFKDLSKKNAAVLNYLKDHLKKKDRQYLLQDDYSVYYLDYDWSLNEQK